VGLFFLKCQKVLSRHVSDNNAFLVVLYEAKTQSYQGSREEVGEGETGTGIGVEGYGIVGGMKHSTGSFYFSFPFHRAKNLLLIHLSFWASAPEGADPLCPHHLDVLPFRSVP
jgi:hypothetical protein